VKYILNKPLAQGRPDYSILGTLIFLQMGISSTIFLKNYFTTAKKEKAHTVDHTNIKDSECSIECRICMSPCKYPTITNCGHIFCWDCITKWCATKPECPLDRTEQKPSQLLRVCGI